MDASCSPTLTISFAWRTMSRDRHRPGCVRSRGRAWGGSCRCRFIRYGSCTECDLHDVRHGVFATCPLFLALLWLAMGQRYRN
jgi:hypothetical protein